jgi:hypothetical protein
LYFDISPCTRDILPCILDILPCIHDVQEHSAPQWLLELQPEQHTPEKISNTIVVN